MTLNNFEKYLKKRHYSFSKATLYSEYIRMVKFKHKVKILQDKTNLPTDIIISILMNF